MTFNVEQTLADLRRMTTKQLQARWLEVFGEPTRTANKTYLVKRIIWRMQALAEGGMEDRLRRLRERALQIANDADLRIHPRKPRPRNSEGSGGDEDCVHGESQFHATQSAVQVVTSRKSDPRLPMPGTMITRHYKGHMLQVMVRHNGLEYEGRRFKTLSAVAKYITGSHCNGYLFFKIGFPRKTSA